MRTSTVTLDKLDRKERELYAKLDPKRLPHHIAIIMDGNGRWAKSRHLPRIAVPMLFVQGTRDAFARPDLLDAVLARLGEKATLHRIEGGDHSFGVPKSSGRTAIQVEAEVQEVMLAWLERHGL